MMRLFAFPSILQTRPGLGILFIAIIAFSSVAQGNGFREVLLGPHFWANHAYTGFVNPDQIDQSNIMQAYASEFLAETNTPLLSYDYLPYIGLALATLSVYCMSRCINFTPAKIIIARQIWSLQYQQFAVLNLVIFLQVFNPQPFVRQRPEYFNYEEIQRGIIRQVNQSRFGLDQSFNFNDEIIGFFTRHDEVPELIPEELYRGPNHDPNNRNRRLREAVAMLWQATQVPANMNIFRRMTRELATAVGRRHFFHWFDIANVQDNHAVLAILMHPGEFVRRYEHVVLPHEMRSIPRLSWNDLPEPEHILLHAGARR